ncbi:MAG TPA: hypothetical protein VIH69_06705 [Dehalococcoidia bacterium]
MILSILQIFPIVLTVVQVVKRFIPDKQRDIANPALAAIVGLIGAYVVGGQAEVLGLLIEGLGAALAAIGTYKVPKEIGLKLGIK